MWSKAQVLSADFALAASAFLLSAGLIYFFWLQVIEEARDAKEILELSRAVRRVAGTLLTEGVPQYWNASTVQSLGLCNEGKLNETKVLSLWEIGYDRLKELLGIGAHEFWMAGKSVGGEVVEVDGKKFEFGLWPQGAAQVSKATRLSVLKGKVVVLEVVLWK